MPKPEMSPGQKAVEERFELLKNNPVDQEKTPVELFGEMEAWTFTLGEDRLFLNPFTKRWYYYDRPHDDWKDIDAPAGTVVFSQKGGELVMERTGTPAGSVAPSGSAGQRFCQQCGAPLKPGLRFCSSCGTKIS